VPAYFEEHLYNFEVNLKDLYNQEFVMHRAKRMMEEQRKKAFGKYRQKAVDPKSSHHRRARFGKA